jgi:hypothetical protein
LLLIILWITFLTLLRRVVGGRVEVRIARSAAWCAAAPPTAVTATAPTGDVSATISLRTNPGDRHTIVVPTDAHQLPAHTGNYLARTATKEIAADTLHQHTHDAPLSRQQVAYLLG